MTESAEGGESGGRGGRLRNFRRTVMHDETTRSSAQDATRSVPRSLHVRIRRLLGFGLMRASAPLRPVIRSGEPICARARLETARIEERYYYRQQISRNPYSKVRKKPEGEIKLILPYDGEEYFTREAYRDVKRARDHGADRERDALVGFLALTKYENTDLGSVLSLDEKHGSLPIMVRLPATPGPGESDPLLADNSSCVVSHDYRPIRRAGQINPAHLDVDLGDPDTAGITKLPKSVAEGLNIRIMRQVEFTPDLSLRMIVYLHLPRELADSAQATVSEVFIRWPTHTSLRSLKLHVNGEKYQLRYNPERGDGGGLEWRDVPMNAEPEPDGGDIRTFRSTPMVLSIPKPGDLYRQDTLDGEVEVTVDRLLSGTDARLFDATGKLSRPQGPELESVISTEFSLTLDDAFARRVHSPYQQMHFDEVIPGTARIDDIITALRNRGFTVTFLPRRDVMAAGSQPGANPDDWWLKAWRIHGPDTLEMLLYVTGKRYRTRRERQVHGGMAYNTTVDSGELQLYVYGFLPGDSKTIVHEINALRRALRERFDRLPDRR
jgi:hypothetical protein